jgi:hypothetical protein
VTATATAPVARAVEPAREPTTEARSSAGRVALALLALLAIYGVLSLANDPRGFLGTDTGGKVATLRAMDARGDLDPDLGYWAERFDPEGVAHPIALNYHLGHRWVNVTTLPMLYAAVPLYAVGGLHGILLLPMLGGCLCALGARALARRLASTNRERTGWLAFWSVGLATPVAVYALDFWEHTLGLAAMLWAVIVLLDVAEARATWRAAAFGGALFGLAATMRTEALVYALATFGVVGVTLLVARRRDTLRVGAAAAVGFVVPLALNQLLERAVLGDALRSSRASSAVSGGAHDISDRAGDALRTTVGLNHYDPPAADWLLGGLIVGFVAIAVVLLLRGSRQERLAWAALLGAACLVVARFANGLGFVPGMLVASPLAVAGLVAGWATSERRRVIAIALGALPIVWLYQYRGGANPQWGGRYVLLTGALLAVLGVVGLRARGRATVAPIVIAGLLMTGAGLAWLSQRSHGMADSATVLQTRDPVLTIGLPHQLREWGAWYAPDQRWLTAEFRSELPVALDVLEAGGARRLVVVARFARQAPPRLGPFVRTGQESLEVLPGTTLAVARYRKG